jgi:polyisoprenoid-binding protein YceI
MKTLRFWGSSLVALLITVSANAQPQQAGPTYQVDKDSSRVYIRVNRTNRLGHNHGVEGKLSAGKLVMGGAGSLVFDMTTFTADTAQARRYVGLDASFSDSDKVNSNMRGAEVLDVNRFPQASCNITSIMPADRQAPGAGGRYMVDGQFTLHGKTKTIRFLTELKGTNQAGVARLTGWFKILQSDYAIKPFSAAGGVIGIEDELIIYGDLVLRLDNGR